MKRSFATTLILLSCKLFALEFHVAPSLILNKNLYEYFTSKDYTTNSTDYLKLTGVSPALEGVVISPAFRHNWLNTAKLRYGYGKLTGDTTTTTDIDQKFWQIAFEDTMAFYSKVHSRTAPYLGAGYEYNQLTKESDEQLHNKRFYIPAGFIVHATKSLTFDVRYEKDFSDKYNELYIYSSLTPLSQTVTDRIFDRGQGFALSANWDFSPKANTGLTLKYSRHQAFYNKEAPNDFQSVRITEDKFFVQFHWLGN